MFEPIAAMLYTDAYPAHCAAAHTYAARQSDSEYGSLSSAYFGASVRKWFKLC